VPRPVKSVEFSSCTEVDQQKRVRRKWKSFNAGSPSTAGSPVHAINNNTVDILTEWREELADEQNINALLKLSKDLLNSEGGQPLGPDELSYRQEQALYWLCKAAERGSKEARDTVTEMLKKGQGLNESNFEAVYACSWSGGLTVSQLMGRRLGRKAFRQLDLGRGFCTSDQIFRMIKGKDVNQMDAVDIHFRCLSSEKVTLDQMAEAGSQQMEGFLPDLDKRLNVFRPALSEMSLWFILTTLFFTGATMTFYGYSTVAPTLILFLATSAFLYNIQNYGKRRKNFKGWKKLWPGNLLIPGLFESALMKFEHRNNLHSSLCMMVTTAFMAFFSLGSYINYLLAFIAFVSIRKDITILSWFSYLIQALLMNATIPYHLMPYQLQHLLQQYDEPVIFQLIPCLMLSYESWRAKKPQLLWPPLISISYCISLQTVLWSGCYAILCMSLSFRTGIKRFKCVIVSLLTIILMLSSQESSTFLRGQPKQTKELLNWNDYHHLCLESGETAWLQRPEQQLQCSKFVGLPLEWTGEIAGVHLRPSAPWFIFHETFHAFMSQPQLLSFLRSTTWDYLSSYWLSCNIKLTLIECKILMGIQKYKTIFAQVSNANLCLNLEVGQEVQFSGLVYDFGQDASTHIYIQTLTKL